MEILDLINNKIETQKRKAHFKKLNKEYNETFSRIFDICRLEFGKELLEINDIKNSVLGITDNDEIVGKELMINRIFSLIDVYFKLAENYVSFDKDINEDVIDIKENSKDKLQQIFIIIQNLSLQIKMNSFVDREEYQNVMNEAMALSNVLEKRKKTKF